MLTGENSLEFKRKLYGLVSNVIDASGTEKNYIVANVSSISTQYIFLMHSKSQTITQLKIKKKISPLTT